MKDYRVLCEMFEKEIEAVENRGKMDMNILDMTGKLLDNIKDISIIRAMQHEEEKEGGYSSRRPYEMYEEGMSYGMSRDSKYHKMLEDAKSDEERELIKKLMEVRKVNM